MFLNTFNMKIKEKPCKGIVSETAGFGCGALQYNRKKGLGVVCGCWARWLSNTDAGKEVLKKSIIYAKKIKKSESVKRDKEIRESLKTKSDYEKELQVIINTIVRTIDKNVCCISSLKDIKGKFDAGHYFSVGSTPSLRFNLNNIYAQSVEQNRHKGGNPIDFIRGVKIIYGSKQSEYLTELRSIYPVLKLSIPEIKEYIVKAKQVIDILNKEDCDFYPPEKRVLMRFYFNNFIGIYGKESG